MAKLDDKLAALATMSPAQLRGEWLQTFRTAAPAVGHRLLALAIAHRLQAQAMGGLSAAHAGELARLGARYAKTGEVGADAAASLKVGSRLVRDWGGVPHQVLIREDGYAYGERVYRSLSHIAREITGANWSGPRFFGLVRRTGAARAVTSVDG
jgi:hypothetical protein